MKAWLAAAAVALLLTGCTKDIPDDSAAKSQTVSTETESTTATTVTTTVSTTASTEITTISSAVSTKTTADTVTSSSAGASQTAKPDDLTDKELADMEAVDEATGSLMQNPVYQQFASKKKAEIMQKLLMKLAAEGTKNAPYPLIEPLSIRYDESNQQFSFSYTSGVLGGVRLAPFDPTMN